MKKKDMGLGDFNRLYKEFSPCFSKTVPGFHNLLWQIQMNQALSGAETKVVFTANYVEGGLDLCLAYESGGYTSTGAFFDGAITYDKACEICERLNLLIFGFSKMSSYSIIAKSMRNKPRWPFLGLNH